MDNAVRAPQRIKAVLFCTFVNIIGPKSDAANFNAPWIIAWYSAGIEVLASFDANCPITFIKLLKERSHNKHRYTSKNVSVYVLTISIPDILYRINRMPTHLNGLRKAADLRTWRFPQKLILFWLSLFSASLMIESSSLSHFLSSLPL